MYFENLLLANSIATTVVSGQAVAMSSLRSQSCAGVDGCRRGWVVATRSGLQVCATFSEVMAIADLIAVDMPIGMPPPMPRRAELECRRYISPRGSTIFPTPPRACLSAATYLEACELSMIVTGKKISKQAWNILSKIHEIDDCLSADNAHRVIEVHPESSFTAMNGDCPLSSKHREQGRIARRVLLEPVFGPIKHVPIGAKIDDVFDVYAALWSAERFCANTHRSFPATEMQRDQRQLLMRIVT